MKIKDLMTRGPHSIGPDGSLRQASCEMKAYGIGFLPVCDEGRLVGIVTDRDIVVRALAANLDPAETRARAVMTADPVWCRDDDELADGVRLMESRRVRRVPVLDRANKLVGVLSLDDIARPDDRRELAGELLEKIALRRPPPSL
jgi:CBS domain-containing protein